MTAVGLNLSAALNGGAITISIFNGSLMIASPSVMTATPSKFTACFGVSGIGPITEITFDPGNANRTVPIDNLSFGAETAVPEPHSRPASANPGRCRSLFRPGRLVLRYTRGGH